MKTISAVVVSFTLGFLLAAAIGFKVVMATGYDAVIGKLTDNVTFYHQIEQGKPELTQSVIRLSLDWFIDIAEQGENSLWISPSEHNKQTLLQAKALQAQLKLTQTSQ